MGQPEERPENFVSPEHPGGKISVQFSSDLHQLAQSPVSPYKSYERTIINQTPVGDTLISNIKTWLGRYKPEPSGHSYACNTEILMRRDDPKRAGRVLASLENDKIEGVILTASSSGQRLIIPSKDRSVGVEVVFEHPTEKVPDEAGAGIFLRLVSMARLDTANLYPGLLVPADPDDFSEQLNLYCFALEKVLRGIYDEANIAPQLNIMLESPYPSGARTARADLNSSTVPLPAIKISSDVRVRSSTEGIDELPKLSVGDSWLKRN